MIREVVGPVLGVECIYIFELKKEVRLFIEKNKVGLFLEPLILLGHPYFCSHNII